MVFIFFKKIHTEYYWIGRMEGEFGKILRQAQNASFYTLFT